MATGNSASMTTQQTVNQVPPHGAATPVITQTAIPPPSRRELVSWWKKFRKTTEKDDEKRGSSIPSNAFPRTAQAGLRRQDRFEPGETMYSLPLSHTGPLCIRITPFQPSMLIIEQPLQILESSPFLWPKVSDMPTSQYLFPMIKVKVSSMATFRS